MKTIKLSALLLLILCVAACTKNDYYRSGGNYTGGGNMTTDQAAYMISSSLAVNSAGIVGAVGDISLSVPSLLNSKLACGATKSDSVTRTNATGATTTYTYKAMYAYTLKCNASSTPDSLISLVTNSNVFNGPNLSSSNSGSSSFIISKLSTDSTKYLIGGEYKTSGSYQSKIDTANHGSNNVDIVITGLTVTKFNRNITAGNATFTLTGSIPNKGGFSYTGTIVFNSNATATVTINATVYLVNLMTGQTTKQ